MVMSSYLSQRKKSFGFKTSKASLTFIHLADTFIQIIKTVFLFFFIHACLACWNQTYNIAGVRAILFEILGVI